ncbi:tRNA (uracil-5-)-methyltransferase homolog A-like [Zophobas morio]|uniref:tRNA (uracil-5-)-methyltransferase homolog A-like n=1 Tax=Zophobas morio TaxID=2755281 RepID=UPI003082D963
MTPADQLNDKLCPYWRKRYEEQLSIKEKNADELFRDLANCLRINSIISKLGLRIMRSPVMTGYLNKLDLICGSDGRVGVPLKQNEDGEHMVVNPKECLIIPEVMKLLACEFENFLTTTSYQVYIEKTCSGHYQQLSLRTNRNSEVLCLVKFHPQNISAEQLNEEKFLLKTFFETLKTSKNITIKCLLFQQTEDSSPANPAEFLYGESSFLVENWMDLKFQVSISSLFPPNFSATTHLLMEILDWCSARKYHYIFDIFCGTGIQGLSLAPTVMKVIGIDESKEAIEEAEQNLAVNKYNNVQFIHGVVEDELPIIFKKYGHMESIGIVNRPMSFTSSLSRIIRSSAIKRLVYINTFSRNIMKDIACLCQDFAVNSKPFKVMKYRAFDTEPHNPNFEVAVLLERF